MKRTEQFALVAALVYLATITLYNVSRHFVVPLVNDFGWSRHNIILLSLPLSIFMLAAQIVIGVWLFRMAKRQHAAAWVWFTAGLVFGIPAAILFYCMKIHKEVRTGRQHSEQPPAGDVLNAAPLKGAVRASRRLTGLSRKEV